MSGVTSRLFLRARQLPTHSWPPPLAVAGERARGWGDARCGGARRRGASRGGGARPAAPAVASAAGPRPGRARRGGRWAGAARLAAPGGGGVCAGMEALRRSRKLQLPAASLPSGLAGSQFAGRKCTVCVFSNFKEEGSPWPPLPFWDWSGCVYWGAGSAGKPIPGRASVFLGGGVSLRNRRPRSLSLPFCRL